MSRSGSGGSAQSSEQESSRDPFQPSTIGTPHQQHQHMWAGKCRHPNLPRANNRRTAAELCWRNHSCVWPGGAVNHWQVAAAYQLSLGCLRFPKSWDIPKLQLLIPIPLPRSGQALTDRSPPPLRSFPAPL